MSLAYDELERWRAYMDDVLGIDDLLVVMTSIPNCVSDKKHDESSGCADKKLKDARECFIHYLNHSIPVVVTSERKEPEGVNMLLVIEQLYVPEFLKFAEVGHEARWGNGTYWRLPVFEFSNEHIVVFKRPYRVKSFGKRLGKSAHLPSLGFKVTNLLIKTNCTSEKEGTKMSIGIHHYITKYVNKDGERYVEAWIQVDFLCWRRRLSKRRVVIGRAAKLHQFDGISTCDLVDELSERDGVAESIIAPYASANVKINGPARLLAVID